MQMQIIRTRLRTRRFLTCKARRKLLIKAKNEFTATGRRKEAVASVRMAKGSGLLFVNGKDIKDYFSAQTVRNFIMHPLKLTNSETQFDVKAKVSGGGIVGQAGAFRHGLARALILADSSFRAVLKSSGCLTRDSRTRERKKSGQPGARKRFQFSKR